MTDETRDLPSQWPTPRPEERWTPEGGTPEELPAAGDDGTHSAEGAAGAGASPSSARTEEGPAPLDTAPTHGAPAAPAPAAPAPAAPATPEPTAAPAAPSTPPTTPQPPAGPGVPASSDRTPLGPDSEPTAPMSTAPMRPSQPSHSPVAPAAPAVPPAAGHGVNPWAASAPVPFRAGSPFAATAGADGGQAPGGPTEPPAFAPLALGDLTAPPKRERRQPGWIALVLAMVLTALLTLGGSWVLLTSPASTGGTPHVSDPKTSAQTVTPVTSDGNAPDWQAVAAAVSPAVVFIQVVSQSSSDIGSGVVYDAQGHIVTNDHVINSALNGQGRITVTLADGRMYEAEVVGSDQTTDLAVIALKNPPSDLTVANFGSSSGLAVGQQVMAIGSPLGLSNTATTGIISALDRPVEVSTTEQRQTDPSDPFGQLPQLGQQAAADSVITNAIQVDASINPGNSGGPLFDASGAVIGINSSIAAMASRSSSGAGSIGLGFAIPVDLVTSVTDQLISSGKVDHAVMGVQITTATTEVDGVTRAGAQIAALTKGGAAEAVGLREGDVIIAVDGHEVPSSKSLSGFVRRYTGGTKVKVTYVRDGKSYDVEVTLQSKQS